MYCVNCGVELADSETVCPLCGTRVFHPDLPRKQAPSPYPADPHGKPEEVNRSGILFVMATGASTAGLSGPATPRAQLGFYMC